MIRLFGGGGGLPPGVAGDGLTPGGLIVQGNATFGDYRAATWSDNQINGSLLVADTDATVALGNRVFVVQQDSPLPADSYTAAASFARAALPGAHVYQEPLVVLYWNTLTASDVVLQLESDAASGPFGYDGPIGVRVNVVGGLGLFGHVPPTAPRTLAQATITAITDANAKTAVQALANTLADMGALTIT